MARPAPTFSLAARLAHGIIIVLFVVLGLTGLRLAWFTGEEWIDARSMALIDTFAPSGEVYKLHSAAGMLMGAVGMFYVFFLIISGEVRRLSGIFSRYEYSFLKKASYLGVVVLAGVSVATGYSMYLGLYREGEGFLTASFLHQWGFRLLVLFAVLHVGETVIARGRGINIMFFGKRFVGFYQWPALLIAAAVGVAGWYALRQFSEQPQVLRVHQEAREGEIDGYELPEEWATSDSIVVQTQGGANLAYGATPVTVKAYRTGQHVYFLLRWRDDTRSVNRHLMKTDSGWVAVRSEYIGPFGEDLHYEDQAALYFDRREGCMGTCHIGRGERMGAHTTAEGDTADVWLWMAVSTNPTAEADDHYWVAEGDTLTGGRRHDNKASGGYRENLDSLMRYPYFVPTHRIFKDWLLYGAPGYEAYDDRADTFAVGSRIPAVLVAPTTGDRGDVEARGVWRDGVWTVEMRRGMTTGSPLDLRLTGELHFGVALFDNAEKRHTYHLRPIRLIIE